MIKKQIILVSAVAIMLLLFVGCSKDSDNLIAEQAENIEILEQKIEGSDKALEDSKTLVDEAVSEVASLKSENEGLSKSLEESQAKLTALETEMGEEVATLAISPYPGMSVLVAATQVLEAMRTNDYVTLASYVEPMNGVHVSPYQYIDFSNMVNLSHDNILNLATEATVFSWGYQAGSGDLISSNILDYYNDYIYDEDYYIAPVVGMNTVVSSGNMINNIATAFPTTDSVEFLFPQFDPTYGGLDWSSLTLVFNTDPGMPMLIGIVHGEWTP